MNYLRLWLVPAALLLVSPGFVLLGRWQLDRAEVNRAIEQSFLAADALDDLEVPLSDIRLADHRYRHMRLTGRYEPAVQVLLDNMTREGRAGYEVLTPFLVDDADGRGSADRRVLVNRGWAAAAWDRADLPDVSVTQGTVTIEGRIDRLPRAGFDLGSSPAMPGRTVVVMSFPDYDAIETVLDLPVYRFQLLLSDSEAHGFAPPLGPETDRDKRNIAYAVQWFALAALALSIAIGIAINGHRKAKAVA